MAELKKNGLWNDVQSGATNVADRVLGPSADYISMIQVPAQKGVGQNGDIGQLMTNAAAVGDYIQQLITGPLQGNAQFVETGGMCKAPGGGIVPRWSYVNNRSSGSDVMPPKIQEAVGGGVLDGIIPGMFGDLANLNPLTLMNGLYLNGVPECEAIVCPVTTANGVPAGNDVKFMTYGLEENIRPCVSADTAASKTLEDAELAKLQDKEPFEGVFAPAPFQYGPAHIIEKPDNTQQILLGLASVALVIIILRQYNGGR
jgi:hypothetical protein